MRNIILAIATLSLLTACSAGQDRGVRVQIQDPCMTKCTSLFNRCTDEPGTDMARCNEDRAACESQCTADEVTEEEGEGVITEE